jgi:O-antigen biosynthesis protein
MSKHSVRPSVVGKFLHIGDERFLVRGATYGTFAPDEDGRQFPTRARIAEDFLAMSRVGINTVRTYTVPDRWLLDEAARCGLKVMVGIPWTQHVAFLDDRRSAYHIRREVASQVREIASHPAVLLVALGNEIPPAIVRWHGARAVEQFLRELHEDAKAIRPDALYTYVNFPPTEYLELPFVDVCAFNVYLHHEPDLRRYLARLQHVAGSKPLLLAEAGVDSIREGEGAQGDTLAMQLRAAFAEGLCGAVAFAWTDEWWRGGQAVDDWAFGLVDRDRQPKPALEQAARVFREAPFSDAARSHWPRVSVVVCAYNAADTLDECLTSLERLTYPDVELIVINDGSRDDTGPIARRHPRVRLIETSNGGLSAARNLGLAQATGEIVAYTDADVRVDPDWLTYLVQPFLASDVMGAGGPNVVPPDDTWVAQCVARAPGGPTHVMLDDRIAEHVPGCNMAFRREALLAIGGFNPIYLRAGDDVDVCWRLQQRGWTIGFAPSALVWHRHRTSVRAYWRQQVGYGEGEQWLVPQHPDKFAGRNIIWHGHIYSSLPWIRSMSRPIVNSGTWGTSAFPSVYRANAPLWAYGPHSARWQTVMLGLLAVGVVLAGTHGVAGLGLMAVGLVGLGVTMAKCVRYALATDIGPLPGLEGRAPRTRRLLYRGLLVWLHVIQPFARAWGQLRGRFSAPPQGRVRPDTSPSGAELRHVRRLMLGQRVQAARYWSESWTSGEAVLRAILPKLRGARITRMLDVDSGWDADRDISIRVGLLAWLDLRVLVEEHASGRCLVRVSETLRAAPQVAPVAAVVIGCLLIGAGNPSALASSLMAILVGFLSILVARFAWRLSQTVAIAERSVARVAAEWSMIPMPNEPDTGDDDEPAGHQEPLDSPAPLARPIVELSRPLSMVDTRGSGFLDAAGHHLTTHTANGTLTRPLLTVRAVAHGRTTHSTTVPVRTATSGR